MNSFFYNCSSSLKYVICFSLLLHCYNEFECDGCNEVEINYCVLLSRVHGKVLLMYHRIAENMEIKVCRKCQHVYITKIVLDSLLRNIVTSCNISYYKGAVATGNGPSYSTKNKYIPGTVLNYIVFLLQDDYKLKPVFCRIRVSANVCSVRKVIHLKVFRHLSRSSPSSF